MIRLVVGSLIAALVLLVLLILLARQPATPEPLVVERALKGDLMPPFVDRWATAAPPAPAIARTEPPAIPVPTGPALLPTNQQAPAPRRDVCTAHGLRKQYYKRKGWTYWRCV